MTPMVADHAPASARRAMTASAGRPMAMMAA